MRTLLTVTLLFVASLALAQNVAPRLQDIGVTPGRDLRFTLQNGLFDTTQAVSAKLYFSAGGRLLPVQPTAGRTGRDVQVYLSGTDTQKLPAVSYLQILIGNQPAYVGNVVTSYAGRPGTIGSPIVVNYVVSGGGGVGAVEIANAIAPLSLSVTNLATGLASRLLTTTYTANRAIDQAATTAAQNTANTALTLAGSATATAAQLTGQLSSVSATVSGKVDKATTVTVNGVTQNLSGPVSFSVDVPISQSLTVVSQLSNDANYQTGAQVGAALLSAVNSVTAAQQVTDNNQTLSLSQKASIATVNSFTTTQSAIDAGQSLSIAQNASDVVGKLSTGTYTTNRATDQAATTTAQNTANTALTTANSATATLANKVDKATTITVNGVSQSLSGPVSFTIGGTNSTTLTQVSQLSNDANYQSGSQVASSINSATATLANSQSAVDNAQNSDIANRVLTSTYTTNRSSDQAATSAAQTTANTALSTANSATATSASNSTAISAIQAANYQTASQVSSAINSATATVVSSQTAVDAAQNVQIATKLPGSFSAAQTSRDAAQDSDIANRLLTSGFSSFTAAQQTLDNNQAATIAAVTATANSATATGASNTTAITALQSAGYQTAGQVATAINSATATVVGSQTAVDAAQNSQIAARQPTLTEAVSVSVGTASIGGPTSTTQTALLVNAKSSGQLITSMMGADGVERFKAFQNGQVDINGYLRIMNGPNGSHFRIQNPYTPTSTTDATGAAGQLEWNDNAVVVKTNAGWKQAPLFSIGAVPTLASSLSIVGNVTSSSLTAGMIYLAGANAAETAGNTIRPLSGGGLELAGNTRLTSGGIGAGGNFDIKPDGNLYMQSNTNGSRSIFMHNEGISINRGTNTARAGVDIGSNAYVDGTLRVVGATTIFSSATVTGTLAVTGLTVNGAAITNTNSGDQTLSISGQQLTISGANGNTVTLPASGGNYVLQSASPYVPVVTGANSSTITDLMTSIFGQLVTARDQASLQTLINSLPTSTTANGVPVPRLVLYGRYDFSASANNPLVISKSVELIGMGGTIFDGGTTNGFLVKFNNVANRALFENITFRSRSTTSAYALVYANEEFGDCNNVTFRTCRWHAPAGNYNAFGANAHNGTTGVYYRNWRFENCLVDSVGRMGWEILSQKNDGVIRITNLVFDNCRANNVGLYNPANVTKASAQINGMGWSISGDIDGVTFNNPIAINPLIGIEIVSVRNVNINNPTISGFRSMSYSDGGGTIVGATGISLTDGGSTDRGVTGRSAFNVNITGGIINVAGKNLGTYYVDRLTVNGLKGTGGAYMEIQHGNRITMSDVDYDMTGRNFIASFEDVKNSQIRNCTFSRLNNTVTPIYQPINLDGNTANNQFSNITIVTNTAYNGGNPDNYYNDQQPFRLRYINEAGTNNSISSIFLNGQRMPDVNNTIIPTRIITDAGSQALLKHIERVSFNPAVNTPIGSYTLTMPQGWYDGQPLDIYFGGAITSGTVVSSLSLVAADGNAVMQSLPLTNVLAGSVVQYRYVQAVGRWFEARLAPKGNYVEVPSYDALTKLLPVKVTTTFYVANDEVRNPGNPSEYRVWTSGAIMWQASQKVN